jgi:hypothetical protein
MSTAKDPKNPGYKAGRASKQKNGFVKIPNPYSAYDIESGKWFYHEDVIHRVKSEFESSPPRKVIVIHGFIGSGKTSTLLRMVDEPELLGQRYIPVYITGDTAALNAGAFFVTIYNAVKDKLSLWGYPVDKPNYSYSPSLTFAEISFFINTLESKLEGHRILLIIDDFEKIQQQADPKTMEVIREFFEFILAKTGIFRLILTGKGDIFKLVRGTDMSYLVNIACKIELGMFLAREKIETLIVGPVGKYVDYSPQALREIVAITGRNLYCQQMLCHYIIEYLNEKKQNTCSEEDVRQAVYKTITDKREDFDYFWNHLPYRRKIVMAALADEQVMKKRGRYYFITESPLLDSIFDSQGLNDLLAGLSMDQHINGIKGKRFDGHPFTIPLYGEWVKQSHPLVNTVLENWEEVIEPIPLSRLGNLMDALPAKRLPLEKEIISKIKKLSRSWRSLKTDLKQGKVEKNKSLKLVQLICQILGFEVAGTPNAHNRHFTINMNRLNLSALEEVMLFTPVRQELSDNELNAIKDEILAEDRPANPSFILCFMPNRQLNELARKPFLGIVLVEEEDLKKCALSATPLQVFKKDVLIRQIRPSVVSPYKTEGPVRITFYGRQDEIGRILGKKVRNFAIVGARKIGKTSLLLKIMSELPPTAIPIYMDLEAPESQDYQTFLAVLQEKINEKYHAHLTFRSDLGNFSSLIKQISQRDRKPFFFLDECDILLRFDKEKDYKLLTIFRALAQERYCQVIISGFRQLYLARKGIDSPLYNFLEIIKLDRLKERDALALISEPMETIGINYAKSEDRKRILQHTSCHPNLMQFFCKGLVEHIQEKEDGQARRIIYANDIDALFDSFEYENYVVNDFYLFFTKDIHPVERLIILLLLQYHPETPVFTATDIIDVLKENGIDFTLGRLSEHLTGLSLRYILSPESGGKFRFALPIFPEILKKRYDLENLIKESKEDATKSL